MCSVDIFLGLLAILFPPLPVWVKRGICSADSLINILLCMLGFLPGLLHSWYIIARFPEPEYEYEYRAVASDPESVTYVFVQGPPPSQGQQPHAQYQPQRAPNCKPQGGQRTYGTTDNSNGSGSSAQPAGPASQNPQPQQGPSGGAGEGSSDGAPPPSYAQVVAGDNKIQTHD